MKIGAILVDTGTESGTHPSAFPLSPAQRLIRTLQNAGVTEIAVLTSLPALAQVERHMARWGVLCLTSPIPLRSLLGRCSALLLAPTDVPFVSVETLDALLRADEPLIRPWCGPTAGWPVRLPSALLSQLLEGDLLLPNFLGRAAALSVPDEGVLREALPTGKWPTLQARRRSESVRPSVKLRLCGERPFLGPGVAQLLSLIDATGSVRMASQQMGISYSKAWKMISVLEEELEETVVLRCQGGKHGGSAHISPFGRDLMEKFRQLEQDCQRYARIRYRELFP